ncbi:MAG: M20/M25/M40 family metallo-hydrolase, partial [Candidatus Dojkabacteria bacterium]
MNQERIKKILGELISCRTVNDELVGSEEEFDRAWYIIDIAMKGIKDWGYKEYEFGGYKTRVYSHQKYIKQGSKDFSVYLYGHIDVVAGHEEQFFSFYDENSDRFYGRGAADFKYSIAVAIETLMELQEVSSDKLEQPIALVLVSDEEIGGQDGVKALIEKEGYTGKIVIIPDGDYSEQDFLLELANKGAIHTHFTAEG